MASDTADIVAVEDIDAVRRFSRFYTRKLGVLQESLYGAGFTLTETRVLYEIDAAPSAGGGAETHARLCEILGLDPGYLSRILKSFEAKGLIARRPSPDDGRRQEIAATDAGRAVVEAQKARSRAEVGALLAPLSERDRRRLSRSLAEAEALLDQASNAPDAAEIMIRPHRVGDLGWMIGRHGAVYDAEYGWGVGFEALVAQIALTFMTSHDPEFERCWIAERAGENLGSAMVVRQSDAVAKLRLVLVEPTARGSGLGRKLLHACLDFAAAAGYRRMTLWTQDVLAAARHLYASEGFDLVATTPHADFGVPMVGETWERALDDWRAAAPEIRPR